MSKEKKSTSISAPIARMAGNKTVKTPQPVNVEEIRKELSKQIKLVK